MTGVDGGEKFPGLADGDLGRSALAERILDPPDRLKGIQYGRMPGHEGVEEMPERREGLVLGGRAPRQLLQEPAGLTGRDLSQLQSLVLAPGEKLADGPGVGPASVGVGDPRGEELVRGEAGGPAGAHEDRRKGRFKVIFKRIIFGTSSWALIIESNNILFGTLRHAPDSPYFPPEGARSPLFPQPGEPIQTPKSH